MKPTSVAEHQALIERHFAFLLTEHGYELVFLATQGRYSEYVFGMHSRALPKFQFGGETGPYVAVAASTVPFSLESEGGCEPPWLRVDALDDFLAGRGAPWVGRTGFPVWDSRLKALSEVTRRLFPWLARTFVDKSAVDAWRGDYDRCVDDALKRYLGDLPS